METTESISPEENNGAWGVIATIELTEMTSDTITNKNHIILPKNGKYFDPKDIINSDGIDHTIFDTHNHRVYSLNDPENLNMSNPDVIREVEKVVYITESVKNNITDHTIIRKLIKDIGRIIERHCREGKNGCFAVITCNENDKAAAKIELYCSSKRRDDALYFHVESKMIILSSLLAGCRITSEQVNGIVDCKSTIQ